MAKILVIDDDPSLRKLSWTILKGAGFEVDTARDGAEGSAMLDGGGYDLVVTDLIMPNKEGIELIIECRRLYPQLKIIAVSGGGRSGSIDVLHAAEKLGAAATLHKPFSPAELLSAVTGCLAQG